MNKTVVITGASTGIGKAIAYKFASEGHDIIISARREDKLKEIKSDIEAKYKVKVETYKTDLSILDEVNSFYDKVKGKNIEVFINNAGFGDINFTWNNDTQKITQMIDLNIKALTILSSLFVKDNKDKDVATQLINVSSVVGYGIRPFAVTYSASKFFVSSFTEGLDATLKSSGSKMRAKVLAPAATETEFFKVATDKSDKGLLSGMDISEWTFHTSEQMGGFTYDLYKSDKTLGIVAENNIDFLLEDGRYDIVE